MYIMKLPVHKSRPPTRRSTQSRIRSSTTAASKTVRASSESIRARASTTVEYGNRLERIGRRRAQGRRPSPDAGTGARAFNVPVAFSPNTPVTGSVIGNRHPSRHSFRILRNKQPRACQDAGSGDGTSNQDRLETSKVNALDNKALHGVRLSTRHVSFLGKGWASTDNTATTPTYQPPRRTGVQQISQSKTAHRAGYRGTRIHHQATRTGRLETTPVRRPRVGPRAIPLSTPTLTPILVPWASHWNYKRGSPGANRGMGSTTQHYTHTQ